MGKTGSFDYRELKQFAEKLEKLEQEARQGLFEASAKELASRLLTLVIMKTPVGDYPAGSGMTGGTLRRGWVTKTQQEAENNRSASPGVKDIQGFLNTLNISHSGENYVIEVMNPVEYASYVEKGHRTVNHKGWVTGHFMLTLSERELQTIAPGVLEKKLIKFWKECMR